MSRLTVILSEALKLAAEQEEKIESHNDSNSDHFQRAIEIGLLRGKIEQLSETLRPAIEAAREFNDNPFDWEPSDTEATAKALLEAGRILGVE